MLNNLRKIAFVGILASFSAAICSSQHFIGKDKFEIAEIMKAEYKHFKLNTSAVNKTYNYLKYEDRINEMTMLFFLSEKGECTLVRLMGDYSNINDIIEKLNESYEKVDKDSWEYSKGWKKYTVELEDGEWYFTVTTREKK